MKTTNTEVGFVQGARGQRESTGPTKLLQNAIEEAGKDATRTKIHRIYNNLLQEHEDRDDYITIMNDYWFNNALNSLQRLTVKRVNSNVSNTLNTAATRRIAEGILAVNLLELPMPNGKALGDCTGQEVREMRTIYGRFLGRIAEQVAPGELVRKVFKTQESLKEVFVK